MKQLFTISQEGSLFENDLLVCELSHYHICVASFNGTALTKLAYYEKATPLTQSNLTDVLQKESPELKSFKTLLIGSAFPDHSLVPQTLSREKDLKSFLQHSGNRTFTDVLPQHGVELVYTLPEYFLEVFANKQLVQTAHVHAAALQSGLANNEDHTILLHFTSKEFRVVALKNGQLQLAQIYPFTAPLDVVYYLLMISAQYNLPQAETTLVLSGLVDEASALYKELFQYYTSVRFASHPEIELPQTDYHQHYFSSILNLAACASLVAR